MGEIDYFDFLSDLIITINIFLLLYFLSRVKQPRSIIRTLVIGFSFLYFSLLTDVLDEIFLNPIIIKNIGENLLQVLGYITVCFGTYNWLKYNEMLQSELKSLSNTDPLTGVMNRRAFIKKVADEIERSKRYKTNLSLIIIGIDYFKKVNDEYGHNVGDVVLKIICSNVSSFLRSSDAFCRWGGEEFTIMGVELDNSRCKEFCEKIRADISELPIKIEKDKNISITVSIGCTTMLEDDDSLDVLLDRADKALYLSKENGRNLVTIL